MFYKLSYPFIDQTDSFDCGITCLKMISKYYGKRFSSKFLAQYFEIEPVGVSMSNILSAAKSLGFDGGGYLIQSIDDLDKLTTDCPIIFHWGQNHFVLVYKIKKKYLIVADPSRGIFKISKRNFFKKAFVKNIDTGASECYLIKLKPTSEFYRLIESESTSINKVRFLKKQLTGKLPFFLLIVVGLAITMALQFTLPYFTKSVIDIGVFAGNLKLVRLFLLGQVAIFAISLLVEVLRSWLVINLSSRINFSMISTFLKKIQYLPIPYFEVRKAGDFFQRINDNHRVESFLTRSILNILISILSIVTFSVVLYLFDFVFFLLFLISSSIYVLWILLFISARKKLDWERFEVNSKNQTILLQMVNGIEDLKIYNSFSFLHKKWERNQMGYIKTSFKSLRLTQIQESGATFIYQIAQSLIIFYAAKLIIEGELTLGAILSIQFIIGQLVAPIQQLFSSLMFAVDTKLSIDRVFEVLDEQEEKNLDSGIKASYEAQDIILSNVKFKYKGQEENVTVNDISIKIPKNKTTAFVGLSGSGKTTVVKLLLGYFPNYSGDIFIGEENLQDLNLTSWRQQCGVVFQDNYIFNDTIAKNVALGEQYDIKKIDFCLNACNMYDYIYSLPKNILTVIGKEGKGLSQGQKQRLFIARAIYNNPNYLFLDEATNSLDSENEYEIIRNIREHFENRKTIVFIAHRLSTVKHADNIVVFENGNVIEQGSHEELLSMRGKYVELINKQLQ